MPSPRIRVLLCRHARTALNADGRLRGHLNPSLDDVGRAEAASLGRALQSVPMRRVVSSPLARSVETAAAIAEYHDATVVTDRRLIDRDYGPWSGKSPKALATHSPDYDGVPGVEPSRSVLARARSALEDQLQGEDDVVVLMSHDAVNRMLLHFLDPALGGTDAIPQRTACWNLLLHDGSSWIVARLDQRGPVQ